MRVKTKLLFCIASLFICFLIFAIGASAASFYVSTTDELKEANKAAIESTEADTIYITADITGGSFVATSSVTYVLQANWTKCSTNTNAWTLADYVDISFMADGDNRTLSFSGNVFQTTGVKPTNSTINFGGLNGGRLIVDMSGYTNYFMYNNCSYTINLYDVTFKDYSFSKNDWVFLSAKTLNIYDGAKIEGCSNANGVIIAATTINMYGGEIYNNYTTNNMGRIIDTKHFNMFGGSIHHNFNKNTRSDNYTNNLIQVSDTARLFGGSIYSNYFTFTPKNTSCGLIGFHGTTANKGWCVADVFGTNYGVDSSIKVEKINGEYTLTGGTATESNNYRLANGAYSVMFKNDDGTVVEAYIFREDATLAKSLSNASEATIPSGKWATVKGGCVEVTPVLTAQATYYVAGPHRYLADDFNCETKDTCIACGKETEALTHVFVEILTYAKGVMQTGEYTKDCTNPGCTAFDVAVEANPIFTSLGYSATERSFGKFAITQRFYVDKEALARYNEISGYRILEFGVVAGSKDSLDTDEIFENGKLIEGKKVVSISLTNGPHDYFDIKITGLEGSNNTGSFENTELYCCGYFIANEEEELVSYYIDKNGVSETLKETVSYSDICPVD